MLSPGTKIGVYEVASLIGKGGMGEVYRAHDARLQRDVALKVLPEAFSRDAQRMSRFEREARLLASLNHANIAAIYGLEESGPIRALVMELVEGPTLADRILGGPVPVEEALPIARQIADAVEYAHDNNVIHRDLKPANIKIKADGAVKVLDFGLARAMSEDSFEGDMSNSPTLSMAATRQGVILGTAAYMSPEQARGKKVDRRTDVWAFGVVLFEILTGKQAFDAEDVSMALAAVMKSDPDWNLLPKDLSPTLKNVLHLCLQKDPKKRLRDMGDVRLAMDGAFEILVTQQTGTAAAPAPALGTPIPRLAIAAAALIATASLAAGAVWLLNRPAPLPVVRTEIATSAATALIVNGVDRDVAISPDGSHIAYRGANGRLLVRALDQIEPTVITGVGDGRGLFFSPDGQWIGFADGAVLKKVAITGGPTVTICSIDAAPRGAAWGPDGTIVFATNNTVTGLFRVSEGGGDASVLTKPGHERGETDHLWPEFLPGGQSVLFTIAGSGGPDNSQVAVLDLRTGSQKIVLRGGSHAHYVRSGHLIYAAVGTLRAVPFDLKRLETTGIPVPVVSQVLSTQVGAADFDVARNGSLVYVPGSIAANARTLVWLDRQGHEEPIQAPPRAYAYPRLAPDGTRIALDIRDQENDIWVWDLARETLTRLTFDPAPDRFPVWTPDSKRIIFASDRTGVTNLYRQAADNTGTVERLLQSPNIQWPYSVSPDGTRLVFEEQRPSPDLMILTLDKEHKILPLVQSQVYIERDAEISPDGHWMAYQSNESGQFQIYVRPFPDVNSGRWQVSTMGGTQPLWARSGQELFYVSPDGALMRVPVERGQSWQAGTPTKLFDNNYAWALPGFLARSYEISADGKRFLAIKLGSQQTGGPTNLIVVQNWFEELKRKAPAATK
jgi:Tol biopolymer transport system component